MKPLLGVGLFLPCRSGGRSRNGRRGHSQVCPEETRCPMVLTQTIPSSGAMPATPRSPTKREAHYARHTDPVGRVTDQTILQQRYWCCYSSCRSSCRLNDIDKLDATFNMRIPKVTKQSGQAKAPALKRWLNDQRLRFGSLWTIKINRGVRHEKDRNQKGNKTITVETKWLHIDEAAAYLGVARSTFDEVRQRIPHGLVNGRVVYRL